MATEVRLSETSRRLSQRLCGTAVRLQRIERQGRQARHDRQIEIVRQKRSCSIPNRGCQLDGVGRAQTVNGSQARRLLHTLARFREISLDFRGVPAVGQAFADEVFRVFQNAHPDIAIVPENMNENVAFMVRRALAAE